MWSGSNSTAIDCTELNGWQSMTDDSFAVVIDYVKHKVWSGKSIDGKDGEATASYSKSYDSHTGKLIIRLDGTCGTVNLGDGAYRYKTTEMSVSVYAVQ